MDYCLSDALGSVRQLTDATGTITYARSYDPYGVVAQTSGASQSTYGCTNEYASQGLVYLRARHYAPGMGRFLTRDTWGGEHERPHSLNRWNYVEGNPVNMTDPTGHYRCETIRERVEHAETYVNRTNAGHLIMDEINTYTAGGIGVQCAGTNFNWPGGYSGEGLGQISDKQVQTAYGEKIFDWLDGFRGCGLTKDGEEIHDQNTPVWAVHYMRRRIQQVVDACDKCTSTDKFIAAALAQNGPGFPHFELTQTVLNKKPSNPNDLFRYLTPDNKIDSSRSDGVTVNWSKYFIRRNDYKDTYLQLNLFAQVVFDLQAHHSPDRWWYVPRDLNWNTIWAVATK